MKHLVLVIAVVVLGAGCASSRLEQRIAHLERELAATKQPTTTRAITPAEAVAIGNTIAAAQSDTYVLFVGGRPSHCSGALCWRIDNGQRGPVLLFVNGQQVVLAGTDRVLLNPGESGYIRMTKPMDVEVVYEVYDTISMDSLPEMPLPTLLRRCRTRERIGTFGDVSRGGHSSYLGDAGCL